MKAPLLFPDREIVERFYVPSHLHRVPDVLLGGGPRGRSSKAVDGEFDPAKMQKLISSVIESGHGSTIEHVVFTFAITGVSRTLSHQLVRHRAGVAFDQQSQRYVKFKGPATMLPHSIAEADPELASATRSRSAARSTCTARCWGPGCPARMRGSSSRTRPARTS